MEPEPSWLWNCSKTKPSSKGRMISLQEVSASPVVFCFFSALLAVGFLIQLSACACIRPDRLNHLMYVSVTNDIERKKHPNFDVWKKPKSPIDFTEFMRFMAIKKHVI